MVRLFFTKKISIDNTQNEESIDIRHDMSNHNRWVATARRRWTKKNFFDCTDISTTITFVYLINKIFSPSLTLTKLILDNTSYLRAKKSLSKKQLFKSYRFPKAAQEKIQITLYFNCLRRILVEMYRKTTQILLLL